MKSIQNKKDRKRPFLLIAALIIVLAAVGFYLWQMNDRAAREKQAQQQTAEEQRKTAEDLKERFNDSKDDEALPSNPGSPANPSQETSVKIDSLTQDASGNVVVTTTLAGSSWSKCTLTATKAGATTVIKTAKTVFVDDHTTCEGFSIPRNEFSSHGQWTLTLNAAKIDGNEYETTKSITLQ